MVKSQPKDQLILWGEYSGIKIKAISYAPPAAAGKSKLHENNMSYPRPCNRVVRETLRERPSRSYKYDGLKQDI